MILLSHKVTSLNIITFLSLEGKDHISLKINKMEHSATENLQVPSGEIEYHALEKRKVKKENEARSLLRNNH